MDFLEQLHNFEDFPTSYTDLERMLRAHKGHNIRMVYHDFRELPDTLTTQHLFGSRYNVCALILPVTMEGKTYYHWSVLLKQGKRIVFWESYGLPVKKLSAILGDPKLMNYLNAVKADAQTYRFQERISHVSLCGQYAILRAVLGEGMSNAEFHKQFTAFIKKLKLKSDLVVSLLTLWNFYPMKQKKTQDPGRFRKYKRGAGLNL